LRYFFWTALIAAAALSACGGGDGSGNASTSQQPKAKTVQEALIKMEATGQTPALDRSDSVTGPDANANGVRDDIEAYVNSLPDTAEQKQVLLRQSKALTAAMAAMATVPPDETALRQATNLINIGVACIYEKYPELQADKKVSEMRKLTVNTRARYNAYMAFSAAVSGIVLKRPREVNCG
jgi:hypothetical protein